MLSQGLHIYIRSASSASALAISLFTLTSIDVLQGSRAWIVLKSCAASVKSSELFSCQAYIINTITSSHKHTSKAPRGEGCHAIPIPRWQQHINSALDPITPPPPTHLQQLFQKFTLTRITKCVVSRLVLFHLLTRCHL